MHHPFDLRSAFYAWDSRLISDWLLKSQKLFLGISGSCRWRWLCFSDYSFCHACLIRRQFEQDESTQILILKTQRCYILLSMTALFPMIVHNCVEKNWERKNDDQREMRQNSSATLKEITAWRSFSLYSSTNKQWKVVAWLNLTFLEMLRRNILRSVLPSCIV